MSNTDRFVQIRDAAKARGDHNFAAEAQAQLDRMGYQETPGADAIGGEETPGSEDESAGPGGGPGTSSPETVVPSTPVEKVVPPKPEPQRRPARKRPTPRKATQT